MEECPLGESGTLLSRYECIQVCKIVRKVEDTVDFIVNKSGGG